MAILGGDFGSLDTALIVNESFIRNNKEDRSVSDNNFIHEKCGLCGGTDIPDYVLSEMTLSAGYGSEHDGECVRIPLCAKCVDHMLSSCKSKNACERS